MATILVSNLGQGAHITRPDGARLRKLVEEHWADPEPVSLDFTGLRIASASFFDEAIGLLALEHGLKTLLAHVVVKNIDPSDRAFAEPHRFVTGAGARGMSVAMDAHPPPAFPASGVAGVSAFFARFL